LTLNAGYCRTRTTFGSIFTLFVAVAAFAGDLNPPAGPITSTMKTLTEVEPRIAINTTNTPGDASSTFRITQPGSYYLIGNITGEAGKVGIRIETSNVTIDLSGYAMIGVVGSSHGITSNGAVLSNIRVTNGVIRSWGGRGFLLNTVSDSMYDHLRFSGNCTNIPTQSLYVGNTSIITDCVFENNFGNAISADSRCVITRCSINGSTGVGLTASGGCLISECTIAGGGSNGIEAGGECRIERCVLSNNAGIAISAGSACEVRDNSIFGISAVASIGAILVNGNCLVRDNFCRSAGYGIRTIAAGNTIIQNHFSAHTNVYILTANNHVGPFINAGNTVAITGSANLASTMASTDPNANFIE
jgi:hypothetical protein